MHRLRRNGADAEHGLKQTRARTQIGDVAQKFQRMALRLKRIVLRAVAFQNNFLRLHFQRAVAARHQLARRAHSRAVADGLHRGEILHLVVVDDLHRREHRAIEKLDEADAFLLAVVAHPAFHRHNLTFQRRALGGHVAQIKHILICHKYFLFSADKMSAFLSVYTAI